MSICAPFGRDDLIVELADGRLRTVPSKWTDLSAVPEAQGTGGPPVRLALDELVLLARWVAVRGAELKGRQKLDRCDKTGQEVVPNAETRLGRMGKATTNGGRARPSGSQRRGRGNAAAVVEQVDPPGTDVASGRGTRGKRGAR